MVAKFILRHAHNNFFWRRFMQVWLQSLQKVLWAKNLLLPKINMGMKNAEFDADFEFWEKVAKISWEKSLLNYLQKKILVMLTLFCKFHFAFISGLGGSILSKKV
jgi:hypothetical protein